MKNRSFASTARACRTIEEESNQNNDSSSKELPPSFKIPAPTWSIASLELDKPHPTVDRATLDALAKRALIDVRQLEDREETATEELQQQVGNMMHMMNQVLAAQSKHESSTRDQNDEQAARDTYDVPRNVQAAPLRRYDGNDRASVEHETAAKVWESLLAPKTKRVGGHAYFVIPTQVK